MAIDSGSPREEPRRGPDYSGPRRRIAVNTAIFSFATGLSRIAGLGREILASSYFATSGAFSAFTIAFQVPNLLRMLVADQAITAAFVPVFTELLEQKRRAEALRLASTLFFLILAVLGSVTVVFVVLAPLVMPLFTGGEFTPALDTLTSGLSRLLFPVVVLLGLNGLCVAILNAYDHFTIPALAPLAWNVVIVVLLVVLRPLFEGPEELYAYAIGVLAGTVVQFLMAFPVLRRHGFELRFALDWRDPRIKQVVALMLPVTIGLGVINVDLVINSMLGSLVSEQAPRAIDAAFRLYQLPQGMFSIALATVLFPALTRAAVRGDYPLLRGTMANGVRQILLLLLPAAAISAALATPIVRLVYEHGEFGPESTDAVAEALLWFSFALPFNGANLLLTRTLFSLQRPWTATTIAIASVVVNTAVSLALYAPLGIAGLVIGTVVGNAAMAGAEAWRLRGELGGIDGRRTAIAAGQMILAAGLLAGTAYATWWLLDDLLDRGLAAQCVSVGVALTAGGLVYTGSVLLMRIPEASQILDLLAGRLRGRGS
ncbi:MAG: murein biosynthesis integral membrane protein MurJ [Solirubrobacteraceae bacterium]